MSENTTPAAVGSSEELGHLFVGEAYHHWLTQPAADAMRCVDTRAAFEAGWSAAMAAERDRWQQAAKAVIESHDAALAYVYERLRSQGVMGITIHDTAAAEIRAVNALRELVQPNDSLSCGRRPSARNVS